MSSMAMPASSRAPTTWTSACGAARGRARVSLRMCSSSVTATLVVAAEQLGRALGMSVAPVDHDLDALAADLGLELVRGAPGDDLAVVDDRDGVRQLVRLLEVLRRQQERGAAPGPGSG